MKLIILIFLALFTLNSSFAQKKSSFSPSETKNNLKIGLNTDFFDPHPFAIAWEFKVANKQSMQIEFLPIFFKDNYSKTNGLAIALSYRKYISKNKEGLQGIYFSPMIKYGVLNESYGGSTESKSNNLNIAFLFGKQWIFKSGFSLDLNGGVGYYNGKDNNRYGYNPIGSPLTYNSYGISPSLNIKIGYAF